MPVNCPLHIPEYNACIACRHGQGTECTAIAFSPIWLSDILTTEERLARLEDRLTPPKADTVNITRQDYEKLQRRVLLLEEKLNTHIGKTLKPKSKYA